MPLKAPFLNAQIHVPYTLNQIESVLSLVPLWERLTLLYPGFQGKQFILANRKKVYKKTFKIEDNFSKAQAANLQMR